MTNAPGVVSFETVVVKISELSAKLLEEWGLVKILNPKVLENNIAPLHQIKIISFKEKDDWELIPKYNIGKKEKD